MRSRRRDARSCIARAGARARGAATHALCAASQPSNIFHVRSFISLWILTTTGMSSSSTCSALCLRTSAFQNICGDGYSHVVPASVPPLRMLLACRCVDSSFTWPGARACAAAAGRWLRASSAGGGSGCAYTL